MRQLIFILLLYSISISSDLSIEQFLGYWQGEEGVSGNRYLELFFTSDSIYEVRGRDTYSERSEIIVDQYQGFGHWRIVNDSISLTYDRFMYFDSNLVGNCCSFTGNSVQIGAAFKEDAGTKRLLLINPIRDTSSYIYISDSKNFTLPGPLEPNGIINRKYSSMNPKKRTGSFFYKNSFFNLTGRIKGD
jgi:hypothetical protein